MYVFTCRRVTVKSDRSKTTLTQLWQGERSIRINRIGGDSGGHLLAISMTDNVIIFIKQNEHDGNLF